MGTRFGARTPLNAYVAKVHWIIGGLSALILMLCSSLVYVATTHETASSSVLTAQNIEEYSSAESSYVDVVVARSRIEAGQKLTPDLFALQPFPAATMPIGVFQAAQLDEMIGNYSTGLVRAGYPLTREDMSLTPPISTLHIPPGYRAVTIKANDRELVAGYVTALSRVDVLWRYKDRRGINKVKPLVRFAKVLSVNGVSRQTERSKVGKRDTTVTLLVTTKEAKLIELARGLGSLSMVLLGENDNGSREDPEDAVDEKDLYGDNTNPAEEPVYKGKAYVTDPDTGRIMRYVLTDRWELDQSL